MGSHPLEFIHDNSLPRQHLAKRLIRWRRLAIVEQLYNSLNSRQPRHAFVKEYARIRNKEPFQGRSFAVKDNIVTSDLPTTCSSSMLHGYQSPCEATVVQLLRRSGGFVYAKSNMDEFGMGSHSQKSTYGPVKGILDENYDALSPGGSSGGSAMAVRTRVATGALGTDTGGSIRLPAAYTRQVGFKPSYGRISRWGVVPYANSLDTVGTISKDVMTTVNMFARVSKPDPNDPTCMTRATRHQLRDWTVNRNQGLDKLRIGIPLEYNIEELAPEVRQAWLATIRHLEDFGHSIHTISLPSTRQALSAYYVLAPAEASSNLAKYDGIRYGSRGSSELYAPPSNQADGNSPPQVEEGGQQSSALFSKAREAGFGDEVRRRILLGSYTLSAGAMDNYFLLAQKVRRLVQQDFDRAFEFPNFSSPSSPKELKNGVHVILCPTAPTPPPLTSSLKEQTPLDEYINDVFTVPASLAGLPAISIPVDRWLNNKSPGPPIGMQIIAQYGDDLLVLSLARQLERELMPENPSSEQYSRQQQGLLGEEDLTSLFSEEFGQNPVGDQRAL